MPHLHSPHIPPDMTLEQIIEHTTNEYDDLRLTLHGRTVELGLIRKLAAVLKQVESSKRYIGSRTIDPSSPQREAHQ